MNLSHLRTLASSWRGEAETFRRRGREGDAQMMESVANDLERHLTEWKLEALTLEDAALESGYTYSSLQQRIGKGEIPNAGEKGSPRVRRCDLPLKGGRKTLRLESGEPDLAGEILNAKLAG